MKALEVRLEVPIQLEQVSSQEKDLESWEEAKEPQEVCPLDLEP